MIEIGFSPYMVRTSFFAITWHSFFTMVSVFASIFLVARSARRAGLDEGQVYATAMWAIPFGLVGARLVHVLDYWSYYSMNLHQIPMVWSGGIGVYGAFIGGVLGGWVYAVRQRFPAAHLADLAAPALALGQGLGRIGDLVNGEHYSSFTSLPWGVVYTNPESPGYFANVNCPPCPTSPTPMHPAVGYEMVADLAIFFLLTWLQDKVQPRGTLLALFAVLYGGVRLPLSFIRYDSNSSLLGINQQGWISLLVLLAGAAFLVVRRPRLVRTQTSDATGS